MRLADILAFAFPSRPLHFQFYETHPTHRSNTRRLFPLGIPIEAKHRHPRLVCPRGGEGPPCPALVNHSSVPYSSKPNPSIHDLYLVEKKVGRGKNSGVPNRCATIWRPHACRSRQEPEKKHPFMTRFVALFYPPRRLVETSQSLSLSISRLLKFIVSTRMIRGRSNPLVRTRFHYAKSKENYKRSGYNWTAYGRRMKKRLNLR